jgi:RNA polymerase sigma factor (sigma-70 family)
VTGASTEIGEFMTFAEGRGENQRDNIVPLAASAANEWLALTQGVAAGDESAARDFFQRYCDRLFRYLLVVARGDEDSARETLSIAMIKAARHMKPMRTDEDIWRWLTRLAWTSFVDQRRKSARRIVTLSDEMIVEKAAEQIDGELSELLNESLIELPAEEREIVEHFYFEDRSQNELAEQTNSTRKAVESRLARIRQKLRAAILKKLA